MINTKPVFNVRTLFLRVISLCYVIAFHSLYVQIPGLYGEHGILPASSIIKDSTVKSSSLISLMLSRPTLLWLQPFTGISVQQMMEIICLTGMLMNMTHPKSNIDHVVVRDCAGVGYHHLASVHHQAAHVPALAALHVRLSGWTNISTFPVGHPPARDGNVGHHCQSSQLSSR